MPISTESFKNTQHIVKFNDNILSRNTTNYSKQKAAMKIEKAKYENKKESSNAQDEISKQNVETSRLINSAAFPSDDENSRIKNDNCVNEANSCEAIYGLLPIESIPGEVVMMDADGDTK